MHSTGEYTIADLMEVFSIGYAAVHHVLERAAKTPLTEAPQHHHSRFRPFADGS